MSDEIEEIPRPSLEVVPRPSINVSSTRVSKIVYGKTGLGGVEPSSARLVISINLASNGVETAEMLTRPGTMNGRKMAFTYDTGAQACILHSRFVKLLGLTPVQSDIELAFADGHRTSEVSQVTVRQRMIDDDGNVRSTSEVVLVADIPGHDCIVGLPWMDNNLETIDFSHDRRILFNREDRRAFFGGIHAQNGTF